MVISLVALIPFVVLRKPWAVRLWRQMKTVIVVYAIIIATAGGIGTTMTASPAGTGENGGGGATKATGRITGAGDATATTSHPEAIFGSGNASD